MNGTQELAIAGIVLAILFLIFERVLYYTGQLTYSKKGDAVHAKDGGKK